MYRAVVLLCALCLQLIAAPLLIDARRIDTQYTFSSADADSIAGRATVLTGRRLTADPQAQSNQSGQAATEVKDAAAPADSPAKRVSGTPASPIVAATGSSPTANDLHKPTPVTAPAPAQQQQAPALAPAVASQQNGQQAAADPVTTNNPPQQPPTAPQPAKTPEPVVRPNTQQSAAQQQVATPAAPQEQAVAEAQPASPATQQPAQQQQEREATDTPKPAELAVQVAAAPVSVSAADPEPVADESAEDFVELDSSAAGQADEGSVVVASAGWTYEDYLREKEQRVAREQQRWQGSGSAYRPASSDPIRPAGTDSPEYLQKRSRNAGQDSYDNRYDRQDRSARPYPDYDGWRPDYHAGGLPELNGGRYDRGAQRSSGGREGLGSHQNRPGRYESPEEYEDPRYNAPKPWSAPNYKDEQEYTDSSRSSSRDPYSGSYRSRDDEYRNGSKQPEDDNPEFAYGGDDETDSESKDYGNSDSSSKHKRHGGSQGDQYADDFDYSYEVGEEDEAEAEDETKDQGKHGKATLLTHTGKAAKKLYKAHGSADWYLSDEQTDDDSSSSSSYADDSDSGSKSKYDKKDVSPRLRKYYEIADEETDQKEDNAASYRSFARPVWRSSSTASKYAAAILKATGLGSIKAPGSTAKATNLGGSSNKANKHAGAQANMLSVPKPILKRATPAAPKAAPEAKQVQVPATQAELQVDVHYDNDDEDHDSDGYEDQESEHNYVVEHKGNGTVIIVNEQWVKDDKKKGMRGSKKRKYHGGGRSSEQVIYIGNGHNDHHSNDDDDEEDSDHGDNGHDNNHGNHTNPNNGTDYSKGGKEHSKDDWESDSYKDKSKSSKHGKDKHHGKGRDHGEDEDDEDTDHSKDYKKDDEDDSKDDWESDHDKDKSKSSKHGKDKHHGKGRDHGEDEDDEDTDHSKDYKKDDEDDSKNDWESDHDKDKSKSSRRDKDKHHGNGRGSPAWDNEKDPGHDWEHDEDDDYEFDSSGRTIKRRGPKNVYSFRAISETAQVGFTYNSFSLPAALQGSTVAAPLVVSYTNRMTCGAQATSPRVGYCLGSGIMANRAESTVHMTMTCHIDADASSLCGLKYVQGMRITAQGPVRITLDDRNGALAVPTVTSLSADVLPITGVYVPGRRTTLLADVMSLLSGVKGGFLMFDTNIGDGKFTFYFWR